MSLRKFHGIIPPVISPLLGIDQLDVAGLEKLIEHLIKGGVHGLFILGTTGEAPSLSYRLRRELIQRVCKQVNQRLPFLVGITDTSFIESIELANHAAQHGAAAVVLSTPYYFPAGQTELTSYIEHMVEKLPLPLVIYNMPSLTKVWFDYETLVKLSSQEKIVGIKDSSGDLQYFENLIKLRQYRPDWSIMIGPEAMLPQAMRLGGDGGVSGGANIFPQLFTGCYYAIMKNDQPAINEHVKLIQELQKIYDIGKYASRFIKATKCSASLLEICSDFMAEPFHHFKPPEREKVRIILEDICQHPLFQNSGFPIVKSSKVN